MNRDGYFVYYTLGKNQKLFKLWICAHNEEEAKKLCVIQAGHRHGYRYTVNISHVVAENPPEPTIKVLGYWH